jgi:hypothetical protein
MNLLGKALRPIVVKITLILLFIASVFPPFIGSLIKDGNLNRSYREWAFILNPPKYIDFDEKFMSIDILTLLVEYISITILGLIIHMFIKEKIIDTKN